MAGEQERWRLERGAQTYIVTSERLVIMGGAGQRAAVSEVPLADIVVGVAGGGAGAGYEVRVQHWRAGPALVATLADVGEAQQLAQAIIAAARAAP